MTALTFLAVIGAIGSGMALHWLGATIDVSMIGGAAYAAGLASGIAVRGTFVR